MDPQSQSFTPYSSNNDTWRLQTDVARVQQVQAEHTERIARLEKKHEEDARMKSVWGSNSPFPSVLSGGTPQQGRPILRLDGDAADGFGEAPLQQPHSDQFRSFDDDANELMSSLHLDAGDEPRRGMTANSRANSVRFDETANQNHFSHSSRPSMDYMSRTSSGLGGLQMTERSASHKSEGRASSVHSIRSAASGRANSLNLDTTYGIGDSSSSSFDPPGLPGLAWLGSVPAIIRCWMNTNFKHDALLYAAVCTGSYKSFLELRLIQKLGFEDNIITNEHGAKVVQLAVYFPEAVPHPASSRSNSPAPQLPYVTVDFHVVDSKPSDGDKYIQIFIGSDALRSHNADILFSSNSMTLFDDERSKVSIPLVRPESDATFKSLYVASGAALPTTDIQSERTKEPAFLNGLGMGSSGASLSSAAASPPPGKYRPPGVIAAEAAGHDSTKAGAPGSDSDARPASRQSTASSRPSLSLLNTRPEAQDQQPDPGPPSSALRTGSSPAIWSNWRTQSSAAATPPASGLDWAGASKNRDTSYQRKDTGIKVLKPKTASRTVSSSTAGMGSASLNSPADGKSRFFDEGRRRSEVGEAKKENQPIGRPESTNAASASATPAPKTTKSNPIGGASAFTWLSSGGGGAK
ncbi:uncharacterized protein LTR77_001777 [Saxophila tyrrhenica]|uniref:Ubiquitin carboxyl-terminal hydrolase 19 n=1 Tax=Saxophila tyrrhenica TaxID=1690608 RepID=A0AAV9PM14_9PEZI|nr:hypothetical protein LTR77_001777 [Saxophila tyrrhenica]